MAFTRDRRNATVAYPPPDATAQRTRQAVTSPDSPPPLATGAADR